MEPTNNTKEPMRMPGNAGLEAETEKVVTNGPILVLLAVILLVLLGGLYYWFTILQTTPSVPTPAPYERPSAEQNNEPESTTAEAQADTYGAVSTSDEIEAIEADIEATNLDALDTELNAIDAEFEAAAQ